MWCTRIFPLLIAFLISLNSCAPVTNSGTTSPLHAELFKVEAVFNNDSRTTLVVVVEETRFELDEEDRLRASNSRIECDRKRDFGRSDLNGCEVEIESGDAGHIFISWNTKVVRDSTGSIEWVANRPQIIIYAKTTSPTGRTDVAHRKRTKRHVFTLEPWMLPIEISFRNADIF